MLRKVLSFGLKLTACLSVIPTFAVAADVASQDAQGAAMQALTSFEAPSNTGHLLKAKPNGDTTTKGSVTTLAAASSLSQVFVYAVGSSNCGWEYMTSTSQFSTTCNHGGALMRSVVLEIGYGSNPLAWMVGSLIPITKRPQFVLSEGIILGLVHLDILSLDFYGIIIWMGIRVGYSVTRILQPIRHGIPFQPRSISFDRIA